MWILKRAKTTTFLSRMIFPSDFFSFVNIQMENSFNELTLFEKKAGRFKTVKRTISLKNNRLTNAGRPFYSLSPLFLSSKVKLRGCTTCLWEGTLQQWHYEDQSNCCFMESSNSSDCVSEVSTLLVVMEVFTASVSPMAAIIVTLEPLETISVVVSS